MLIGRTLGHYQVTSAIGSGGMGEVYRATDTTLGREVAIKVLPTDVASDPDRVARFRREARVLASLNHPNIAAIYGFEEEDGTAFLTLELVEGEDLAERLRRGPLPIREALEVAKQIAEALEAAHERGIIHRDLKPANVKVTPSGIAKVLDFGLAKAWSGDMGSGPASGSPSLSPTFARSDTAAGVILGTAAYMSPEQARGRLVDRRADVWAFGVVLFEMLAGRALFAGETITDVIAAIVTAEPGLSALPRETPPAVRRLLRRCLQKDPRLRLPDVGAARVELSEVLSGVADPDGGVETAAAPGRSAPRSRRVGWRLGAAAAVAAALAAGYAWGRGAAPSTPEPLIRLSMPMPSGFRLANSVLPQISPDGRHVVIPAQVGGRQMLWIRHMGSSAFEPVPGTEGAFLAFWAPDSRHLGFAVAGQLKRVSLEGGVQALAAIDSRFVGGGTWSPSGVIVISKGLKGQAQPTGATLARVPATGGVLEPFTSLDAARGEQGHFWPQFLPDGRHVSYGISSADPRHDAVFVTPLDAPGERQLLLAERSLPAFANGHLLFVRNNTLLAQRFDENARRLQGEPRAIAEGVGFFAPAGLGLFSTSRAGVVVYQPLVTSDTQLTWVSREGGTLSTVGSPEPYGQIALSPDGRRAAVELQDEEGNFDIWIVELARGVPTRLTFDEGDDRDPIWSPDGEEVAFGSVREGKNLLLRKALSGGRPESLLFESAQTMYPESWTPDGGAILYQDAGSAAEGRVGWMLRLDGRSSPTPILKTGFSVDELQVSPDGRLLAYVSTESGRFEVYVEPLGGMGQKIRVSTNGGGQPKWRGDGRELFFVSNGRLHAVAVGSGPELTVGLPEPLFELDDVNEDFDHYAPDREGRRFLVKARAGGGTTAPLQVMMNWSDPSANTR